MIFDAGFADHQIKLAVNLALYSWQREQHPQQHHPITHALFTFNHGPEHGLDWEFDIRVLRNNQNGKRQIRCFVYRIDDMPVFNVLHLAPVVTTRMLLGFQLAPLFARLCERTRLDA